MMYNFFEKLLEIVGWFRIMISPTLIGGIAGIIIFNEYPSLIGKLTALGIGFIGLLIGIIWATRIYKSPKGTIYFMSRVSATPELDEKEIVKNDK
ncbi:MAG: hypothetical protein HWD58_19720 [Bacteroidota bacterium]|nr:MAG: hypothetical protein HWD58_19720 [Bacteroidota bacterium]